MGRRAAQGDGDEVDGRGQLNCCDWSRLNFVVGANYARLMQECFVVHKFQPTTALALALAATPTSQRVFTIGLSPGATFMYRPSTVISTDINRELPTSPIHPRTYDHLPSPIKGTSSQLSAAPGSSASPRKRFAPSRTQDGPDRGRYKDQKTDGGLRRQKKRCPPSAPRDRCSSRRPSGLPSGPSSRMPRDSAARAVRDGRARLRARSSRVGSRGCGRARSVSRRFTSGPPS